MASAEETLQSILEIFALDVDAYFTADNLLWLIIIMEGVILTGLAYILYLDTVGEPPADNDQF